MIYLVMSVNDEIYMSFSEATTRLAECPTHQDIADIVGASLQSVRQARMSEGADGYRAPPPQWEQGIAKLARGRADELVRLAMVLEEMSTDSPSATGRQRGEH
jgi:hypothetical protein